MQKKINYKTLFEAVGTVKQVVDLTKQAREFYLDRRADTSFRVSLRDNDAAYQEAHKWLMSLIPKDTARRITAITTKDGLKILYDAKETVEVDVDGHKVEVYIETPEPKSVNGDSTPFSGSSSLLLHQSLVFRCKNAESVEAVKKLLNRLHKESRHRPAMLYTPGRWDDWNSRGPANKRPLESIVLQEGLIDELIDDLQIFIDSEDIYVRHGIPFHRGYLFYGPPGTGKTSIARALAAKVGGDVYALSLNAVKDNDQLNERIREINIQEGGCAALVLEDIDVVRSTRSRADNDEEGRGVTLDGLLNALDGLFTPDGLVVFMTTNRLEGLDEALIRPGRVDMKVEITYLNNEQFIRLCKSFLPTTEDLPEVHPDMKISPADIVDMFKKNINNPYEAYRQVIKFVLERGYYVADPVHR